MSFWEPDPEFYELEKKAKPHATDKFRGSSDGASRCPACAKTVYKAEELLAMDLTWHKLCFKCGTNGDLGCGKKLNGSEYTEYDQKPYCSKCFDRIQRGEERLSSARDSVQIFNSEEVSIPVATAAASTIKASPLMTTTLNSSTMEKNETIQKSSPSKLANRNSLSAPEDRDSIPVAKQNRNNNTATASVTRDSIPQESMTTTIPSKTEAINEANRGRAPSLVEEDIIPSSVPIKQTSLDYNDDIIPSSITNTTTAYNNATTTTTTTTTISRSRTASGASPIEDDFQSFELSEDFGKKKQSSAADKFRIPTNTQKCPVCIKQVYKAEELIAMNQTWHINCFTCGGISDQGCKRKLSLGQFTVLNKNPYCKVCSDKLSREMYSRPLDSTTVASADTPSFVPSVISTNIPISPTSNTSDPNDDISLGFYQYDLNAINEKPKNPAAEKFRNNAGKTTCPACNKTVYKAEELIALGSTWHQACFQCGGSTDQGCKRRLALGTFQVHDGIQFCFACNDRIGREKFTKPAAVAAVVSVPSMTTLKSDNDGDNESSSANGSNIGGDDDFQSYELSDDIGKRSGNVPKKVINVGNRVICPACNKTVYKAEELIALGSTWHQACFQCGGSTDQGCKRRLALGTFQVHDGIQFCFACNDRIGREKFTKPAAVAPIIASKSDKTESRIVSTPPDGDGDDNTEMSYGGGNTDDFQSFELSDDFGKKPKNNTRFRTAQEDANKCPMCRNVVYSAEQVIALGSPWHPACFTCGGTNENNGCKRRLALGGFRVHNKTTPYCDPCFNRLAKEQATKSVLYKSGNYNSSEELSVQATGGGSVSASDSSIASDTLESPELTVSVADRLANIRKNLESDGPSSENDPPIRRKSYTKKFQPVVDESSKCPLCKKVVYKTEELLALGSTWHTGCFTCGGTSDLGCGKKVTLGDYRSESGNPFCKVCFDKVRQDIYAKSASNIPLTASNFTGNTGNTTSDTTTTTPSTSMNKLSTQDKDSSDKINPYAYNGGGGGGGDDDDGFISYELSEDITKKPKSTTHDKFRNLGGGVTKKCPICTKTVYHAEEVIALNQSFHETCFNCGGNGNLGCHRRLGKGEFRGHESLPYCNACFDRIAKDLYTKKNISSTTPSANASIYASSRATSPGKNGIIDDELEGDEEGDRVEGGVEVGGEEEADDNNDRNMNDELTNQNTYNNSTYSHYQGEDSSYTYGQHDDSAEPEQSSSSSSVEMNSSPNDEIENVQTASTPLTNAPIQELERKEEVIEVIHSVKTSMETVSSETHASTTDTTTPESHTHDTNTDDDHDNKQEEILRDSIPPISPPPPTSTTTSTTTASPAAVAPDEDPNIITVNGISYEKISLKYEADFDTNGLIYWLGSNGRTQAFKNPHINQVLRANMSSNYKGRPDILVNRDNIVVANYTMNDPQSFLELDIGPTRRLLINYYTLKHGSLGKGNALRYWILEGKCSSSQDDPWILLSRHDEDITLSIEPRSTATWKVTYEFPLDLARPKEAQLGFRYFRLIQTGPNSSNNDCLFCSGIELYGILHEKI